MQGTNAAVDDLDTDLDLGRFFVGVDPLDDGRFKNFIWRRHAMQRPDVVADAGFVDVGLLASDGVNDRLGGGDGGSHEVSSC